ncbi:ornithine decarboxylase SpeF [Pasteurella canis]|uniref:ornithine decarboxylase n=1 Tax=Pasteurella canis TaxID=753 RepID=A0A379ET21_9PAST|nr:ornithine decarboxylase SpeF [Pasteurella canis]MXN87944.1 ornithine decarboxylase SpeF [Pasteurella canis]UAY78571.1 ornithine decarboxylase SpeF [Pasteurella canis]UDW84717.1 ornithine decarboxylase SpeF [Pasteurella canis]UEA17764.1 ornithine decarboxylase SpeF [Pasteurella canis]SUC09528.1 ornithine decarboxylase [Pasteurella canis]
MLNFKIAYSPLIQPYFNTTRALVSVQETDFTDVAAVVLSAEDINDYIDEIRATKFNIPVFVAVTEGQFLDPKLFDKVYHVQDLNNYDITLYSRQIETAAHLYEEKVLPPFFKMLSEYVEMGNSAFDCPGHQGGQYFRKHPAGRYLYDFYGENIFRSDICNADVKLGDLLIHEGAACDAQKHAAQVFNADKTYFVLNGTSSANKVVTNALLTPGDLVLFDRNNHKSIHHGALVQAGATPIYLETARNPFGFIGGIDSHCFDEDYLKSLIKEVAPEKLNQKRPFRLAVIQLGTYDGTIYNARQVVDKIGHLCDYILFDSAWVGYEQFIPMMRDCTPLLLELNENDPGIFVTQSVHKQQAGFSQASQIHKKDKHIKGQDRYCNHKRFNNAFMLHASTSPFYPLFATLDVNARIQGTPAGIRLWHDCVKIGIEARKMVLNSCDLIKPFIPPYVNGKKWQDYDTEEMANSLEFFKFHAEDKWHKFEGYVDNQYFVDPCKFMLTTPGIDIETGEYESFGVPATILANYLRENGIIPEKCDLNSILFLLTPAETLTKMQSLVAQIAAFEQHIKNDSLLKDVLPTVYKNNEERYEGYTIRRLCQEMHDLYVSRNVKTLQRNLFRKATLPEYAMNPHEANLEFVRNKVELVPLTDIVGRIAAEGALPYPPGVLCVVPGEKWSKTAQEYFLALEEGINVLPGFAPEIQGVYLQKDPDGRTRAYGYVLTEN